MMGCGATALFGPRCRLSFAHCNLPSPLTLQIITAPLKPLEPGSGLGHREEEGEGIRRQDSEMLMRLMDDFQWRRTDGALRRDGGGLDARKALRCVADECLKFCYYRQRCFWRECLWKSFLIRHSQQTETNKGFKTLFRLSNITI